MVQTTQACTFLRQKRVHGGDLLPDRENCFPTVMAYLLGLDNPEAVFQVDENYINEQIENRSTGDYPLLDWLGAGGMVWRSIDGHRYDGLLYMVIGQSHRGGRHACLYQNGQLVHDPHPEGTGLATEIYFELLEPLA